MARRRRNFSSCSSFSTFLFTDLVCFKERTSFNFSKFAQSRRRRFTASNFGVSLLASDADPLRVLSLPPAAAGGYSSEPSDLKSNGESLALVASDPVSSQIWRARVPTSAILLVFVGRDLVSVFTRGPYSTLACCSGYHIPSPHRQPSSAASTLWFTSRHCLHSHAAGRILRLQVLSQIRVLQLMGQIWALLITGCFLALGLLGLRDQKAIPISQKPITMNALNLCRCRLRSPLAFFNCFISHRIDFQAAFSFDWCFGPMTRRFHPRFKTYRNLETANFSLLHWRFFAEWLFHLSSSDLPRYQISSCRGQREIAVEFNLLYLDNCSSPRYQNSSCRGQREIAIEFNLLYLDNCSSPRYQNSSCRGQRDIVFTILLLEGENCSTIILVFMAPVCACVARPGLELEGRSSETLLSDIFKGSANWCFVTPAKVADVLIVISVLVTVSIAKSRSLLVLFASQGLVSLTSSKIVKVRRLHDIYGLSVKIVCIYPFTFYVCVFRLPFEAAMVVLASVVTNSSFYGEY